MATGLERRVTLPRPPTPPTPPDQAAALRQRLAERQSAPISLPAIAVTGGKGGIGKTAIAVNLAIALAAQGKRPLLIDFDLGLANADVLLGAAPKATILDAVQGHKSLADIIHPTQHGIDFVPAASGHDELTRLDDATLDRLFREMATLANNYDVLVIDTAAGIGREVIRTVCACRIALTVVTPEPTAIADAYALIKILEAKQPGQDLRLIINQAASGDDAAQTIARLRKVAKAYLGRDLGQAGWIPRDRYVGEAVRARRPFINDSRSPAAQAVRGIAVRLCSSL